VVCETKNRVFKTRFYRRARVEKDRNVFLKQSSEMLGPLSVPGKQINKAKRN
jgi:hypothetical protein